MSYSSRIFLKVLGWIVTALTLVSFLAIVSPILVSGLGGVTWSFLTEASSDAGRAGGIYPILVSTFSIILICMIVSLPLGLFTAIYLFERSEKATVISRFIRVCIDMLAGTPSIVFGLFGNMFFSQILGLGLSILSGGLTLACMVIPFFVKIAEIGLRQVPKNQILSAQALSLSRFTAMRKVILPMALPSLMGGFVLSLGRALSETAALIFTSGYVDRIPTSFLDSGRSISVHIYDLAMNVPGGNANAYASALVLIVLLVLVFVCSRLIADRFLLKGAPTI